MKDREGMRFCFATARPGLVDINWPAEISKAMGGPCQIRDGHITLDAKEAPTDAKALAYLRSLVAKGELVPAPPNASAEVHRRWVEGGCLHKDGHKIPHDIVACETCNGSR